MIQISQKICLLQYQFCYLTQTMLKLIFWHCVNLEELFFLLFKLLPTIQYTKRIQWPKQQNYVSYNVSV